MSAIQVRSFRRADRDQLTRLVNAHAEAVVPGMSASVNAVLGLGFRELTRTERGWTWLSADGGGRREGAG
jgi:hypothetical protein